MAKTGRPIKEEEMVQKSIRLPLDMWKKAMKRAKVTGPFDFPEYVRNLISKDTEGVTPD